MPFQHIFFDCVSWVKRQLSTSTVHKTAGTATSPPAPPTESSIALITTLPALETDIESMTSSTVRITPPVASTIAQITSAVGGVSSEITSIASSIGSGSDSSPIKDSLALSSASSNSASTSRSPEGNDSSTGENTTGRRHLGGPAIAGIAVAGVLVLALAIGGWFFWRRRQRKRVRSLVITDTAEIGTDGGVSELNTQERPQELPGSRQAQMQELGHSRYSKYAVDASHELKSESEPAELLTGPDEYTAPIPYQVPQRSRAEMTEMTSNAPASNVEAQRRREMEWLEMEEERIRKRRELLAVQGGAKGL